MTDESQIISVTNPGSCVALFVTGSGKVAETVVAENHLCTMEWPSAKHIPEAVP